MATTAQEQLMLELINRARMNPAAEAARQGIDLNKDLAPGTISTAPKQVLAMNDRLVLSADNHSKWMLINDQFDHDESPAFPSGRTGLHPGDRMTFAGYAPAGTFANGENISWTGTFPGAINATTSIVDQHRSLFLSAGHRTNILNADFREIGVGQELGQFLSQGTNWNASMVTQNFALSGTKVFVTGVVYNDTVVNDDFFTVGEQTTGRAAGGSGGLSDYTGGGGGYELGFTSTGVKTVAFNLATGLVSFTVTVGSTNIKLDVVNGHEVWTHSSLTVTGGPITELHALGIQAITLTGAGAGEKFFGNGASNTLYGFGGNDTLNGGAGPDLMFGHTGADVYVVDNSGDIVNETGGDASADTVQSTITFSLANTARVIGSVENLTLIGTASISGTGNGLGNLIVGNAVANVLSGGGGNDRLLGGLGNDSLTGGSEADLFLFNSVANTSTNRDVITDFTHNLDQIWIDNAYFAKLGANGALNPAFFFAGAAAHDANDYIVYNQASGALYYDPNGNAAGGAVMFAVLSTKPLLTASDIVVF